VDYKYAKQLFINTHINCFVKGKRYFKHFTS